MDMLPDRPRIAVVGAGAVGCYYGGRLVQHGQDVHWLLRSDYEHVRQHGMEIRSRDGDFTLPASSMQVYRTPETMPKVDLVMVTLKTTANSQFAELITPLLHDRTLVLTLQNGLGNEQQLADLFGVERILGGLAFVCINRTAPGRIHHSDYGLIKIGEFGRPISARLRQIAAMFNAAKVQCEMLEDLNYGRWEKLIWNVPFNGLGACLGLTTDKIVGHPDGRRLARELMEEVLTTAHAAGIRLDHDLVQRNIDKTLTMGPYRSSMQIDRETGRSIELEAIIGNPLAVARTLSCPVPRLSMLYALLAMQESSPPAVPPGPEK